MKKSMWIWYYGDFEVWQHMLLSLRRDERGFFRPAPWGLDDCYHNVLFIKTFNLEKSETINVYFDGIGYVSVNGKMMSNKKSILLEKGNNRIEIQIANATGLPSLFIEGDTVISDETWQVTCFDSKYVSAGYWNFYDKQSPPSKFELPTKEIPYKKLEEKSDNLLIDAGTETFSKVNIRFKGEGKAYIHYGESLEEALSDNSYLFEQLDITKEEYLLKARAFRYINIKLKGVIIQDIKLLFEYLPLENKGSFRSSNEKLNKIWDISAYTLLLNSREFFLDGIKRDRYVWSGDANQSYLMNYYLFFDNDICKRTILALCGKEPVSRHINTILDYTFYWFISIKDYYVYTGDMEFVKNIFPKMQKMMDFCLSRLDENSLMTGKSDDWVFVDWADIDKTGAVCAEQILFVKALETMKLCSDIAGVDGFEYLNMAQDIKRKIKDLFWDSEKEAFIDSFASGKKNITRHANIFAMLFEFADDTQIKSISENVIMNKNVPPITTPYFKFYELEALCSLDQMEYVTNEILSYWGGMIDLGATTFWEEYNPKIIGKNHYEMYGDEFGKSLCHAWGASPIYLIGKYYLGVKPTSPGYETFDVKPNLGGLDWFEGTVPINNGEVRICFDKKQLRVTSTKDGGRVHYKQHTLNLNKNEEVIIDL